MGLFKDSFEAVLGKALKKPFERPQWMLTCLNLKTTRSATIAVDDWETVLIADGKAEGHSCKPAIIVLLHASRRQRSEAAGLAQASFS